MNTIYIKFYSPKEIGLDSSATDEEIKKACFRAYKYKTAEQALMAYAETPGTMWSVLLNEDTDVKAWINNAYEHIKANDIDWLEANFT